MPRHLTNHERRNLTPAQRALVNTDPEARVKDLQDPETGGFTISPVTGNKPTSGIAVSTPGHEEVHKTDSLTKEKVAAWAVHPHRIREWTSTPGTHYGGWADAKSGQTYLDVSRVYENSPVGRVTARRATVQNEQLANYDLGNRVTESNPLHPGNLPERAREQVTPTVQSREEYLNDDRPMGSNRVTMYEPTDPRIRRGFS